MRAPALPSPYTPFPLLGRGKGEGGNDEGITGSLRYKHDEGNEEDISPTGVGVHTKLDAIFFRAKSTVTHLRRHCGALCRNSDTIASQTYSQSNMKMRICASLVNTKVSRQLSEKDVARHCRPFGHNIIS